MKRKRKSNMENQVYSNRVLRSEFDRNWKTKLTTNGYIEYIATANRARVIVLLAGGVQKLLIFPRGGRILVGGGGTSHYSKPHKAVSI
ncbi:hypothetical protein MK805_06235 [Shimazuella sp. AN120528]|uniref:hypothetical protein n=1 Tax=Shimazuella soli TaxID=1892854 RepID=UPI001F0F0D38|nr:hypothetical protein [Shimazuella soli]MCH5584567.1 hypothetical protein [Shimazuella soli]